MIDLGERITDIGCGRVMFSGYACDLCHFDSNNTGYLQLNAYKSIILNSSRLNFVVVVMITTLSCAMLSCQTVLPDEVPC